MKHAKRILAVLLAAVLLTGLLPAAALTAQAVDPSSAAPDQLTAAKRSSVMLDASGLKKADTVILGYAVNSGTYYPLEWQVGDASADSTGKTGGRLLISKFLLPAAVTDSATGGIDTAASYDSIAMPDGSTTAIHMPDEAAVLPTYKTDTDYIADIGSNLSKYNLWYPADVNAGLSVRGEDAASGRRTLEGAAFFALSAKEAESCITNSVDVLSKSSAEKLLRRPYAAGYAVSDAGDRSWALRGKSLRGDAIAVARGSSNSYYDTRAEGLVREAGGSTLSRPAFNLRTNAISFYYMTEIKAEPSSGSTATPKETPVKFGGNETLTAVTEASGTLSWRVALETLPLTSASVDYRADGLVELVFENNAIGHKIGVLTADSTGKLLSYGTARDNRNGGHVLFKPAEGVSKMYFFAYDYNSDTNQLYTSNLIEVDASRSAGMMLGTGALQAGDTVYFNDNPAIVLNADTGIPGMENTGSSGSLTQTNNSIDDSPVFDDEAMLMMIDTGSRVDYGTTAQLIADNVPFLSSTRYYDEYAKALADAQAELNTAAENGTAAASASKDALKAQQADYFYSAFGADVASPLSKAIAYTWLSDSAYQLSSTYSDGYFPFTADISVQEEKHSVYGKQLFFLSAGEFLALPVSTRLAVGNIILRSKVTETYGIPATSDSLTVISDPAVACEIQVATLNSFFSAKSGIRERAAFHLRKDRIVYSVQSSALDRSLTSSENLHPVGGYDSSCKTWELAILDDTVTPTFHSDRLEADEPVSFRAVNLPSRQNSYVSPLVTDAAGTVKQYGRIQTASAGSAESFTLDQTDYAYGDRVYALYEYETANAEHPTVYTSEPQLIYEKKLDGVLRIEPASYSPCETLYLDTSDVKCAGGSTELCCSWYNNIWDGAYSNKLTCETESTTFAIHAYVYPSANAADQLFAYAEQTGEFPVYPGQTDPDRFTGGTLYYGADSDAGTADYAWTVVGRPTEGISAAKDASGLSQYEEADAANAVELLRKTATPLAGTDTALRGYMNTGVMLTDINDAEISVHSLSADAYQAKEQPVFRMSYADYTKLDAAPDARFAAAENSSWGRDYVLRNHTATEYLTVDPLLNLQSAAPGTDPCTREAINLNNQTVAFYTPAGSELTYKALRKCRQTMQGEWKATVCQPESFSDMKITHIVSDGNSLTVYGSFDAPMEDRYLTAWGVKDGKIVWMDSELCEDTEIWASFGWEYRMSFDEVYFTARKDNGLYRSDICGDIYSAGATEVQVRFYVDGEAATYYDHYTLKDSQGKERSTFKGGEQVSFSTFSVDTLYIQKVEVIFSDGTKITKDKLDTWSYDMDFTVKGVRPVVKVYIETHPVGVEVKCVIKPLYDGSYDFKPAAVNAPSSCLPGHTYDFTVDLQPGFYISEMICFTLEGDETLPNTNPITVIGEDEDGQVRELTGYAPGTYTKRVGDYGDIVTIYINELPFSLQVVADPLQGGTVTASLPDDRSMTTLAAGDTVTVSAQPKDGYVLRGFTMKTQGGEETELTANGSSATFTMPAENTIVTAHFARKNTVTVKLFMDGKLTDTGASWTLKDKDGTERSIFVDGEQAYISATADTGLAISHIEVNYSDGTSKGEGSLGSGQDFDFTVHDTDPVVGIYLTTAQVPVGIEAQTYDAKGNLLEEAGGAVYAPSFVKYGDSFTYNASPNEGYYISAIYRNDALVPNTDPAEYTSGGKTVIGYGAEEYRTAANTDSIDILVEFTKLAEGRKITSEFYDISSGTRAAVTASATYTVGGEETDVFCAGDKVTATVTCKDNLAVVSTEANPDTAITQTDKYTFTFTMPDEDLVITYNLRKLAIRSAYLHVNQDINLIYAVQVPEGFAHPKAVFDFMGAAYEQTDYTVDPDGKYCFEFTHITPQLMGEPVDITVTAEMNGYTYSHTNTGYSIRKYCVNTLARSADPVLNTLLSDILAYGAAAQKYTGYKADALVTEDVTLCPSEYPGLSGLRARFVGTADPDTYWDGVSLCLRNNLSMDFRFYAASTEGLSVELTVDGRTQTVTEFDPVSGTDGKYSISFRGILATEFGNTVSAKFLLNGEQIGDVLKYSVNTYICSKQDDSDPTLAELVRALYGYGVSALTYYEERIVKQ